jgi:hypothetical protein
MVLEIIIEDEVYALELYYAVFSHSLICVTFIIMHNLHYIYSYNKFGK